MLSQDGNRQQVLMIGNLQMLEQMTESDVPFNKSTIQMVRLVQLSFATQMQNQKEIQKSASES